MITVLCVYIVSLGIEAIPLSVNRCGEGRRCSPTSVPTASLISDLRWYYVVLKKPPLDHILLSILSVLVDAPELFQVPTQPSGVKRAARGHRCPKHSARWVMTERGIVI